MRENIQEKYGSEIEFKAKENVSETVRRMNQEILSFTERIQRTSSVLSYFHGVVGLAVEHTFLGMANDLTEVNNRLLLLNTTVINTGLNIYGLIDAANSSRTSLQHFSELFTRIGMSSGKYFAENPQQLQNLVTTLSKQFQMMHLLPSQLLSVQTSILDAFELGFFDWRHMKSGLQHDNPLFRGYIESILGANPSGDAIMEASRKHQFTAQSFLDYVTGDFSEEIAKNFESMEFTVQQIGNILKNEILLSFTEMIQVTNKLVNGFAHGYFWLKRNHSTALLLIESFVEAAGAIMMLVAGLKIALAIITTIKGISATLFGGVSGMAGLLGLFGLLAGTFFVGKQLNRDYSHPDHTKVTVENIAKDVHSIAQKIEITRETLNDLVSRTESMIIHQNIQGNTTLSGIQSERALSEQLTNILKRDMMKNSIT